MKKVFFSASTYGLPDLFYNYIKIIDLVKENGVEIIMDWTKEWKEVAEKYQGKKISRQAILKFIVHKKLYEEHTKAIAQCDAVIAEVSRPTLAVGYQIFYAIAQRKPVLALFSGELKNTELKQIKSIIYVKSALVSFKKYTQLSLPKTIKNFLLRQKEKLIKFNFISNREIENYLNWLYKMNPAQSKSELLREKIINEIIIDDQDYQRYLLNIKT